MKAVLISIQPEWAELIASGKKTIDVRKSCPKLKTPFKCYIYQTKKSWIYKILKKLGLYQGKVIGEFVCDKIYNIPFIGSWDIRDYNFSEIFKDNDKDNYFSLARTGLSQSEIFDYGKGKYLYGWHISDLKIYDKPKEIGEFRKPCPSTNPNSCLGCRYHEYAHLYPMCYDKITSPPQSWCYVEEV